MLNISQGGVVTGLKRGGISSKDFLQIHSFRERLLKIRSAFGKVMQKCKVTPLLPTTASGHGFLSQSVMSVCQTRVETMCNVLVSTANELNSNKCRAS